MYGCGNHKQILTWPEWSKKPENQKLIKENISRAKIKYQQDLIFAQKYNNYINTII